MLSKMRGMSSPRATCCCWLAQPGRLGAETQGAVLAATENIPEFVTGEVTESCVRWQLQTRYTDPAFQGRERHT